MQVIKSRSYLPLPLESSRLYLIADDLNKYKEELEKFLEDINYMNNRDFSKRVLFGQEIKSNNTIEGYLDDITQVKRIIKHPTAELDEEQQRRILNLYYGYKFILQNKEINKDTLKELYSILSDQLLSEEDKSNMGEYYRKNPVYIFYSSLITKEPDLGVEASELDEKMNILIEYLNSSNNITCMTDYFIRSQVAHFYFAYLHPYYDLNGRAARTTAMWYLLKNQAYPYIIFNRAIQLDKSKYYLVIRDGRKYHNVTYFLNYMLRNVLIELEKEYAMEIISDSARFELSDANLQTLYYILSMQGILTYYDFTTFYNHLNPRRNPQKIYQEVLEPLIDKEIIIPGKTTRNNNNRFFGLNSNIIKTDEKIKHIHLENKIIK